MPKRNRTTKKPQGTVEQFTGDLSTTHGPQGTGETISSASTPKSKNNPPEPEQPSTTQDPDETQHSGIEQGVGDVPPGPAEDDAAGDSLACVQEVSVRDIYNRLLREGRWKEIEPQKDEMIKLAKKSIPDKHARQQWVYSELDRLYPPLTENSTTGVKHANGVLDKDVQNTGDGAIQGLGEIPADWPELPANASLASEIAWVQANRLRIVEERPGQATLVRLGASLTPAPSWAALGWLETSIRSYAKYVDVAAKATHGADDEGAVLRRERVAIDEMKQLLDEMLEDGDGQAPQA